MSSEILRPSKVEVDETLRGDEPEMGRWYWYDRSKDDEDDHRWLGCVTHIGSNFVKLEGALGHSVRVHFDEFWRLCTYEPDADTIISQNIEESRNESQKLMAEVYDLTSRLALTPSPELGETSDTQNVALALHGDNRPAAEYKSALILAQKKTLPDLFKAIENANDSMGRWMKAKLIPLQARAKSMKGVMEKIEGRIFNVELYAGLVEKVEQITEGDPAPVTEKLHLMQRRCYMDEECLARYETGGMEFKDIHAFDAWLARAGNRDRIMPFPRCIVAFRVRRRIKERDVINLRDFISLSDKISGDESTFLYIRNGEQLYRLSTEIEFGATLFPDLDQQKLFRGQIYAKTWGLGSSIDGIISENEYDEIVEEDQRREAEYQAALAEWQTKKDAGTLAEHDRQWPPYSPRPNANEYIPFSPEHVQYDDIAKKIADEMEKHNRLVLVLQGLLDRSPALHPHPQWQLWTPEGFAAGLVLVYDESRTLVAGAAPDFEAYRARLNATLKTGSITVGQEIAWEIHEAQKECKRLDNDWRNKSDYRPTRTRPYGDPGPGTLAMVARYAPRAKTCTYEWGRARRGADAWHNKTPIAVSITVPADRVLNVDAYTPGDFRIFFEDPRTRMEYLRWAPYLLEAEEYLAGNRTVGKSNEG